MPSRVLRVGLLGLVAVPVVVAVAVCEQASNNNSGNPTVPRVEDPLSKLTLPAEIQPLGSRSPLELLGLGVRSVTMFNMYVYSVGMYARRDDLERQLKSEDAAQVEPSAALVSRVCTPAVERALLLTPYRKASFGHLRDGFAKAMETRITRASLAPAELEAALLQLQEFKRIFPKENFNLGDELVVAVRGNVMRVFLNGALLGEIDAPLLATSLFAAYIDDKPISTPARASIARGVAAFAAQRYPSAAAAAGPVATA